MSANERRYATDLTEIDLKQLSNEEIKERYREVCSAEFWILSALKRPSVQTTEYVSRLIKENHDRSLKPHGDQK